MLEVSQVSLAVSLNFLIINIFINIIIQHGGKVLSVPQGKSYFCRGIQHQFIKSSSSSICKVVVGLI